MVEKEDRDRILGALDLGDRAVEEIMLHRSNIEMIDADAEPEAILKQCLESPHTRLPVFRDEPENIVGVVHAKDLFRAMYAQVGGTEGDADRLKSVRYRKGGERPVFRAGNHHSGRPDAGVPADAQPLSRWSWMNTARCAV